MKTKKVAVTFSPGGNRNYLFLFLSGFQSSPIDSITLMKSVTRLLL